MPVRALYVSLQLDPDLPTIALDEFKIQQVLVNVFSNAIQAMGDGGELAVRTQRRVLTLGGRVGYRKSDRFVPDERVVAVEIDDSGPGVPADHLTKISDPFFTTKPTGVGTGLGLSVSRQIIEMHNGTIDIENRETGGARVTIMFRLGQERHDAEEADSDRR